MLTALTVAYFAYASVSASVVAERPIPFMWEKHLKWIFSEDNKTILQHHARFGMR